MKNTDPPDSNTITNLSPELINFIESMGRYFESHGIPRIGGRILGLLLISSQPLSAEAIASILRVSRGSVSTNFRLLLASGLAEKVTFPSDRTTYYTFPPTAWEKAMKVEIEGTASLARLAQQGLAALPPDNPARNRLEGMIGWVNMISEVYQKMLAEWRSRYPDSTLY